MRSLFNQLLFVQPIFAAIVSYDWNLGWINANPDGRLIRPVIAINKQWPPPAIHLNVGDTLSVNLTNSLGNQTAGLHWHGLHQNGTNAQDGPPGVTQCGIPPGMFYNYVFTVREAGTFWYHSHQDAQYPDGLRGPLIVHDTNAPFSYDDEHVVTLSDWYHEQMPDLLPKYLLYNQNPSQAEPIPYSALINDGTNSKLDMQPNKTYYFHIINTAAFAQFHLTFDQHEMTIVEIDGVYVQPRNTAQLYIATGQRYGVLLRAKGNKSCNYALLAEFVDNAFDHTTTYLRSNVTAVLNYDPNNSKPATPVVSKWTVFDDIAFVPYDGKPALPDPDMTVTIDLSFFNNTDVNGDVQSRAGFNHTTYLSPKVPTLYTVLSSGSEATNPKIYGKHSNPFVLPHNKVIEIVINNFDNGLHPMHIHGHQPQIIAKQPNIYSTNGTAARYPPSSDIVLSSGGNPAIPARRDTWKLAPNGQTRVRFAADNPGVWFLHCHMEWHMSGGLLATFIEAPLELQAKQPTIPPAMAQICKAQNIGTQGNAAGNTHNYTDLSGAPSIPAAAPWGANIH